MEKKNIVSQIRKKFNISQEELAHILGVSYTSINAWEGEKRIPQEHMLTILNELYNADELPQVNPITKQCYGLARSNSGYVSSIVDYSNMKDTMPFTHGIGRWYGCLPSFLVRDVLQFIRTDMCAVGPVLANFSGSGTVALEAGLSSIPCYAIDVNPMALALSSLKTNNKNVPSLDQLKNAYLAVIENHEISLPMVSPLNLIATENKWLSNEVRLAIKEICSGISKIENFEVQQLLAVALSSIATSYCNIDTRCTNHYVFKENTAYTRTKLELALWDEIKSYYDALHDLVHNSKYIVPTVQYGNTCELDFPSNSMGVVFSHPPYGTTINYYSINRIPNSVLELINFKNSIFNLHMANCKENDLSSGTLSRFNSFTQKWISETYRVLKPGGIFVSIIGDSRDGGKLSHPFTDIIRYGEMSGFILKEIFIWVTNNKSGMHIKRKGNHIDHNYIIIMEKNPYADTTT